MISDEIKPKQPAKYGDPGYFFLHCGLFHKRAQSPRKYIPQKQISPPRYS